MGDRWGRVVRRLRVLRAMLLVALEEEEAVTEGPELADPEFVVGTLFSHGGEQEGDATQPCIHCRRGHPYHARRCPVLVVLTTPELLAVGFAAVHDVGEQ